MPIYKNDDQSLNVRVSKTDIEIMQDRLKKKHVKKINEMWKKCEDEMRDYFQKQHLHYTNSVFSWFFGIGYEVMQEVSKK